MDSYFSGGSTPGLFTPAIQTDGVADQDCSTGKVQSKQQQQQQTRLEFSILVFWNTGEKCQFQNICLPLPSLPCRDWTRGSDLVIPAPFPSACLRNSSTMWLVGGNIRAFFVSGFLTQRLLLSLDMEAACVFLFLSFLGEGCVWIAARMVVYSQHFYCWSDHCQVTCILFATWASLLILWVMGWWHFSCVPPLFWGLSCHSSGTP